MNRKRRVFQWPVATALATIFLALIVSSAAARPTVIVRTADRTAIYNTGGFTFSTPQFMSRPADIAFVEQNGEPEIKADIYGNLYIASIRGVPGGVDLWKSTNLGSNWTYMGQPDGAQNKCVSPLSCPAAGGGDVSLDVSTGGYLYFSSLWLGNTTMSTSMDGATGGVLPGQAWVVNPASGGIPVEDRQWVAAYGPRTVYMTWRQAPGTGILFFTKSVDAGKTWSVPTMLGNAVAASRGGNLAVDQYNGNLYTPFASSAGDDVYVMRSTNAGASWTQTLVYNGPSGTTVNQAFQIAAVDRGGNVHIAFTRCNTGAQRTNCNVFLTSSADAGATWTDVVRVNNGPLTTSAIYPWIVGGSDGVVNVTWYGSTSASPDLSPFDWDVFFAQTQDALSPIPTFNQVQVTDGAFSPVHDKTICANGSGCAAGTRDLLEYYAMTVDYDGTAHISYMDGIHNCPNGGCFSTTWYTKQTSGLKAYDPPVAPAPATFSPNLVIPGQGGAAEPNAWADSHNCIFAGAIGGPRASNSTNLGASFATQTVALGAGIHGGDFDIITLPKPDGTRPDIIYTADLGITTVHIGKSVARSPSGAPTYFHPGGPTGAGEVELQSDRMWLAAERFGGNQYVYIMDHSISSEEIRFAALTNDTWTSASTGSGVWSPTVVGSTDPELMVAPNTLPNTNPGPVFVNKITHNVYGVFGVSTLTTNTADPPFGKEPEVWDAIGAPPPAVNGAPPGPFVNFPVMKGLIDSPAPDPTGFPPAAARTHGTHTAAIFPSGIADAAGNIYVVWATPSARANTVQTGTTTPSTTYDIWFASSRDPDGAGPRRSGEEFYGPWRVSSGAGTSVFPWIDAGDEGKVDIVWYQSQNVGPPLVADPTSPGTLTGGSNSMPAGSTWHVMFAQSLNANSREPVFTVSQVSDHVIHNGSISTGGLTGTSDRSLLDFFEVGIGPDGKANVAWADNGTGPLGIQFARQTSGPLARTPAPGLGCLQPTAVRVASFTATPTRPRGVRVAWTTGAELRSLGFNVWRTSGKLPYRKVNAKLVSSRSSFGVGGHRYEYLDRGAVGRKTYLYKLEVVLTDGTREWIGPIRARARAGAR